MHARYRSRRIDLCECCVLKSIEVHTYVHLVRLTPKAKQTIEWKENNGKRKIIKNSKRNRKKGKQRQAGEENEGERRIKMRRALNIKILVETRTFVVKSSENTCKIK